MRLVVRQAGKVNEFVPDPTLGIITFGRADENDVHLKGERAASRKHFTLERTTEGWKLVDQMSSNGTGLNGEKVNFAFIKEGDIIQVGTTTIQVSDLAGSVVPAPNPVTPEAPPAIESPPATPPAAKAPPSRPRAPQPVARKAAPAPRKKSPVGGLVAAAVIGGVAFVALGAAYVSGVFDGAPQGVVERDSDAELRARQARLDESEERALESARAIAAESGDTLKRIHRLDRLRDGLEGSRAGRAESDIREIKSDLLAQLADEVSARIASDIEDIDAELDVGAYKAAFDRVADLKEYAGGDAYVANLAKSHLDDIRQAELRAADANEDFIIASFQHATDLALERRFEEAIAVCESLLEDAWLDDEQRELYGAELEKLKAARHEPEPAAPSVENEPAEDEPPQDPVVEEEEEEPARTPGRNPLLPDGRESEAKMLASVHARMVEAASSGALTGEPFTFRGKSAKIVDADAEKLVLEVAHIDKRSGDEIVYRTSARWDGMNAEDLLQLYDRTPDLGDRDRLALVIFCFDNGLTNRAATRAYELYETRNEWKEGLDILIASKRKIAIPSGGFVEFDGAFVTPDEKESAVFHRELHDVLKRFERGLGHSDGRLAEESEVAFQELLGMGERAVKPAINIMQEILDKEMERAVRTTGLMAADKQRMDALLDELKKRREHALELIMDTERYPYPYGPNREQVQADVNERVAAVREIWNDPAGFTGQTDTAFEENMNKIREVARRMATIDPAQDYYKETPEETMEYIANIANKELSIQNYAGGDSGLQSLHNYNVEVMEHNDNFPTGDGHTDANGRMQVKITNEYRVMFGRRALKLNDKLFWAARHHSKYCVEQNGGQIAHEVPGAPRGASPQDRMKYEGYPGDGGENIHVNDGGPTARSAHEAWCQSSGHHRNILSPNWLVLGSGKFRTIWTQNFGTVDEEDANSESKGGT